MLDSGGSRIVIRWSGTIVRLVKIVRRRRRETRVDRRRVEAEELRQRDGSGKAE